MTLFQQWVADTVASLSDTFSPPGVASHVSEASLSGKVAPLLVKRNSHRVANRQHVSMLPSELGTTNLYFFEAEKQKRRGHY
jgi:hypothetical protein